MSRSRTSPITTETTCLTLICPPSPTTTLSSPSRLSLVFLPSMLRLCGRHESSNPSLEFVEAPHVTPAEFEFTEEQKRQMDQQVMIEQNEARQAADAALPSADF